MPEVTIDRNQRWISSKGRKDLSTLKNFVCDLSSRYHHLDNASKQGALTMMRETLKMVPILFDTKGSVPLFVETDNDVIHSFEILEEWLFEFETSLVQELKPFED